MSSPPKAPRVGDQLEPRPVDRLLSPVHRFIRLEASGGILLLLCTVAAMIWANSPWHDSYHHLVHDTKITLGIADFSLSMPLEVWINDALMAIFFFLVGLEIKREILVGELSSVRKASVPMIAAAGGMLVPGLIFAGLNYHHEGVRGWGIPTATDIAFALGVLALLGRRVPSGLRIFVATLAIADDLGALIVIAVFYTDDLNTTMLLAALGCVLLMALMNRLGVRSGIAYFCVGLVLWYLVLLSGVHATIAGVLAAMTIPVRARVNTAHFIAFSKESIARFETSSAQHGPNIVTNPEQQGIAQALEDAVNKVQTPLHQFEHTLVPWIAYLVVPIFALANAGVDLSGGLPRGEAGYVAAGVSLGLIFGKCIGIFGATWLAVRTRLGELPTGVSWRHLFGAAWLCGIGFTMSLFIANLAFPGHPELLNAAKIGVMGGSLVAAIIGLAILATARRRGDNHA